MSHLYTPTPSWASSVTIPADSDAGRASGELATSIKTIANRNAWLAGQVTVDSYLVKTTSVGNVTSTESTFNLYHYLAQITFSNVGYSSTIVTAHPVFFRSASPDGVPSVLVIGGTYTDPTSHRIDVTVPYPTGNVSCMLFGATTSISDAFQCSVYSFTSSIPGIPRTTAAISAVRFDVFKVRS